MEKQQERGEVGVKGTQQPPPITGPLVVGSLWVIPDCNSTLSATQICVYECVSRFPHGLLLHISTIRSTFRFYCLTSLSCCVLSRQRPLSQRPC